MEKFSDETLQSLNEKLQSTDMQMETTAIININRRLKLYFGDKMWIVGWAFGTWRIKGNCTCIYGGGNIMSIQAGRTIKIIVV